MTNVSLKAVVLITIMIMSFAITSGLVKGQVTVVIQTGSTNPSVSQGGNANLKEVLDERYLGLLGLYLNETQINSSVTLQDDDNTKGYSYLANFSSGNKIFFINATQFQTTCGNQVISKMSETINGSINWYAVETNDQTTSNNLITTEGQLTTQTSNSSGLYSLNMNYSNTVEENTPTIINGSSIVDENASGPVGNYSAVIAPQQCSLNNSAPDNNTIVLVTLPDGKQETAVATPSLQEGQSSLASQDASNMASQDATSSYTPSSGVGWGLFNDGTPLYQGSDMLMGFYISWSPGYIMEIAGLLALIGVITAAYSFFSAGPVGLVAVCFSFAVVGLVLAEAGMVTDNVLGSGVFNVMYFEEEFYMAFGVFPIPFYTEFGYYGNVLNVSWENYGQPYDTSLAYFDFWDTTDSLITDSSAMLTYAHTSPWPIASDIPVCSVTFNSLDESNYDQRILNIPLMIDGAVVPETADYSYGMGVTIDMPEGTHTIEAPSFGGAFDYMDINGNIHHSNSVNVTISDFTVIDAYYHSSTKLNVGSCSRLYSMANNAIYGFLYSNSYTNSIPSIILNSDTDANVFAGVMSGLYDVGFVDRLPNPGEYNSNTQLYAVGYQGDWSYGTGQALPLSNVIWMVTDNCIIYKNSPQMADGLFVSYVRANAGSLFAGTGYSPLNPDDFEGGNVNGTALQVLGETAPSGTVNFNDVSYFVTAYIAYYCSHIYNPYADLTAQGTINFNDVSAFVTNYIAYYQTKSAEAAGLAGNLGSAEAQDNSDQSVSLSLDGPATLPCVGSSFNVTLNVDNVSDLWAWGTGLQWNPSVLELTNIAEGPFLARGGSTMFLNSLGSPLVLSNGTLQDMGDALFSSSGVSGSGVLATLTFQVLSDAPVNVTLTGSELESPDTGNGIQQIPFTASNLQIQPLTYAITATSDSNSAISPAGTTYVDYGASQTYTITAATGYQIAHVYVDGVDQGPITSYTFSDVTANHSISVVSTAPPQYIFSGSFESGNFNEWTYAVGFPSSIGPQISSVEAYNGTYSAYFPAKPIGDIAYLTKYFSTQQSTLDLRFYMNLASLSGGGGFNLITEVNAANGDGICIDLNLAREQFDVGYYNSNLDSSYSYASSTVSLNAGTWFCLELALTSTTFTLYYNGAVLVSGVFPDGPTGVFAEAGLTSMAIYSSMPAYYVDDVVMSNSYIGP